MSRNGDDKRSGNLGIGIALGVAIGAAFGIALDNLALGIGLGIAVGIAISLALPSRQSGKTGTSNQDASSGGGDGYGGGA